MTSLNKIDEKPRSESSEDEFCDTVLTIFEELEKDVQHALPEGYDRPSPSNPPHHAYPSIVQIGVTNVCNLHCSECYHPKYVDTDSYQPVYLRFDVFKKIVAEVATFPKSTILRFLGKGESFMHPRFVDMVVYAKKMLPHSTACITNGMLLDARTSKDILEAGLDVIDISLDAFTKETYGEVRCFPERFPSLVQNVERFIDFRDRGGYSTKVMVSFLIQPENYTELEPFIRYWQSKVDKIIYRKYHSYSGRIAEKATPCKSRHPCAALWTRVNINEKGLITKCYLDWHDEYVLADLNRPGVSILETWRTAFDDVRENHLNGVYEGLCKNCKGWQTAHWVLSYEQAVKLVEGKNG